MYDMYQWDQPEQAGDGGGRTVTARRAQPATSGAAGPGGPPAANGASHTPRGATNGRDPGARAVQVALDLRDNGGDFRAARDQ